MENEQEADLQNLVDHLYKIDGDCPPEIAQMIGLLRQLINEEFVAKGEQITSQNLYDVLWPKIKAWKELA